MEIRSYSGRPIEEVTVESVVAGELSADDLRIHPDTLREQAEIAAKHGNPQLAANLCRAAELTVVSDKRLLEIYEALRPHRSTERDLEVIAQELDALGATLTATMVREAREAGIRRGLLAD